MSNIIEARNITKRYINFTALNSINISVPEQSIYGLLGPNGAGKTTFIRLINMINVPDEGEIFFNGEKLSLKHTAYIGYLPEERGLYKKMKVGEQALYLAQLKGLSKHDALIKLKYWFERFEIRDWWNKKVEELSKGMQQKVQFMVTVLHEPKLLIFDEPFSGFDPINVNILKDEIFNFRKNGATVIFSTHNMASVEELCDHIALINKSKKILEGEVKQIKKAYKTDSYELEFGVHSSDFNINNLLTAPYSLIEQTAEDGLMKAKVKIPGNSSPNALLELLFPFVTIHSFREILPSMNDIFISKVKADE
jgi:ABC-2 type transport system ATP-binding protein